MRTIIFLLALCSYAFASKWAVLVAGTTGIENYRHQANNAHAYHTLISNGYKPEHIIVFASSDVAESQLNPIPGTLYNHPGDDAIDYNEGLHIDYSGKDCSSENYLKVLMGDESLTGKKLQTNSDDTIFLAYFGHGAGGFVDFPNGSSLFKDELMNTFDKMYSENKYNRIVYYMDAYQSKAMFTSLSMNKRIYAVTGGLRTESSMAEYCGSLIHGKKFPLCVGDEFSVRWMEELDGHNLNNTLQQTYDIYKNLMSRSYMHQWGDSSFKNVKIVEIFRGENYLGSSKLAIDIHKNNLRNSVDTYKNLYSNSIQSLSFYEELLKINTNKNLEQMIKNKYEILKRSMYQIDEYMGSLIRILKHMNVIHFITPVDSVDNIQCYKEGIQILKHKFGTYDYMYKYYDIIGSLCQQYNATTSFM
ncbi:hypothetical protein WA158_000616 [Blastocystis sp. Blastoise]